LRIDFFGDYKFNFQSLAKTATWCVFRNAVQSTCGVNKKHVEFLLGYRAQLICHLYTLYFKLFCDIDNFALIANQNARIISSGDVSSGNDGGSAKVFSNNFDDLSVKLLLHSCMF